MTRTPVARAFDAAAAHYEEAADLQRAVAGELARRIAALPLPERPAILEIGCGTGFLSRSLLSMLPAADLTCTDIAPAMVARTRGHLGEQARFAVMDGETPCLAMRPTFDLICSSLALQWFATPGPSLAGLASLLRPGGFLAFSTLADGSFREWRSSLTAQGLPAGLTHYPSPTCWKSLLPPSGEAVIDAEERSVAYADAHAFLSALKRIGAGTPHPGHRPLPPGQLRRALRGIAGPFVATYHVVYATYRQGAWNRS